MNNDCLSTITQFLPSAEARKINKVSADKNFPKKVVLKSFRDVEEFIRWCQHFDSSNLEEVAYQIYDMAWGIPRGQLVGWVPHGVKVLRIDIYKESVFATIPETVEELHLGRVHGAQLALPDHIKRVTLEEKFNGTVVQWPAHLEELVINGWKLDGDEAFAIDNLPEGLRTMYLSWGVPVEVRRWPASLEELTLVESDDDMLTHWLRVQHAEVPEGVAFTCTRLLSVNEDYNDANDWNNDYQTATEFDW